MHDRRNHPGAWLTSIIGHAFLIPASFAAMLWLTSGPPAVASPAIRILMRPPAPPPPPAAPAEPAPVDAQPVQSVEEAPAEPTVLESAPLALDSFLEGNFTVGRRGGVPGGVRGGVRSGVAGGILNGGGPPPEPPPPPPQEPERIRVGGQVAAPALVRQVAPVYPALAERARLAGMVIVQLLVDRNGRVERVDVLQSTSRVFETPAVDAARQWEYAPLSIDGTTHPFLVVLTVRFEVPA